MKNISKNKIYMIFGIIILLIAIAGSAYAYYSATASASIGGTVAGSANLDLKVEKISTGATGNLIPVDNDTTTLTKAVIGEGNTSYDNSKRCIDKNGYSACQIYKITLTNKSSVSVSVDGGVTLSGDNTPNIECAKMDDINTVSSNSSCKGNKTLAKNYTMDANASAIYYIMVYIKNINSAQTDTGDFSGTVFFNASNGNKIESDFNTIETVADTITKLYTSATKSTVTNNSIEYNYASSVSLMNDRLGGTTTDLDGGNIRYYGASPNNYIYFNCDSYPDTNCELWRIIGVFDGMVKIIRNESVGEMLYDDWGEKSYLQSLSSNKETSLANTTEYKEVESKVKFLAVEEPWGDNDYSKSSLQKILNNYYYNRLKYVGASTYDFTSTGLKNDETRNMIAKGVTWNTGGWNTAAIYSNQFYEYERGITVYSGNLTEWKGKIALPYPSDYGYAADFNKCSQNLYNYGTFSYVCGSNDWMYPILNYAWLLTPDSDDSLNVWYVDSSGGVELIWAGSLSHNYSWANVHPTLYLSSDAIIESGEGTSTLPYTLSVN